MHELPPEEWQAIDTLLTQGLVLMAVVRYREITNSSIAASKDAIGDRFRKLFPLQYASYRGLEEDD